MILEWVSKRTDDFIAQMPKSLRKQYGQFFTSLTTARFMASLFTLPKKKELNILDAGAGSGILSFIRKNRRNARPHDTPERRQVPGATAVSHLFHQD